MAATTKIRRHCYYFLGFTLHGLVSTIIFNFEKLTDFELQKKKSTINQKFSYLNYEKSLKGII